MADFGLLVGGGAKSFELGGNSEKELREMSQEISKMPYGIYDSLILDSYKGYVVLWSVWVSKRGRRVFVIETHKRSAHV